jgi:hypothetical protein
MTAVWALLLFDDHAFRIINLGDSFSESSTPLCRKAAGGQNPSEGEAAAVFFEERIFPKKIL